MTTNELPANEKLNKVLEELDSDEIKNVTFIGKLDLNVVYTDSLKGKTFRNCNFADIIISVDTPLNFTNCKFDNISVQERPSQILQNITITGPFWNKTKIETLSVHMARNLILKNLKIKKLSINSRHFTSRYINCDIKSVSGFGLTNLFDVTFISCKFEELLGLSELTYDLGSDFVNCKFEKTNSETEKHYRILKNSFKTNGNEFTADLFASLELKSKFVRTSLFAEPGNKIFGLFYYIINNFGLNVYRPLIFILVSSFIIFSHQSSNGFEKDVAIANSYSFLLGPFKYLSSTIRYSNINFLLEVLFGFLSGLLWFFLIVGIRKRFKIEK